MSEKHETEKVSRRYFLGACSALAGGVALNAVANGRIRPETPFEELYVQPAAGDSGTAVGAAYYVWNQELKRPRSFVMNHAYTGPEYSDDEIASAVAAAGLEAERLDDGTLFRTVAERIAAGDVVGLEEGGVAFARGVVNFGARDLELIRGRKTAEVEGVLGRKAAGEVIHRDNLALLRP